MSTAATVTCIRNANWIAAYDAARGAHVYLRHGDVAFAGDTILHVGGHFAGSVNREIDGKNAFVIPGLVNVHGHLGTEPLGKGFFEDLGNPFHGMSRLYGQIYAVRPTNAETRRAATRVSVAELMLSGCTTVADMSLPYEGWYETFAEIGVRSYLVPMFKSASWVVPDGRTVIYEWDEAAGERDLAAALKLIDAWPFGGLVGAMIMPAQCDTCTPDLIRAGWQAARERNLPLQIHCGQSVVEFQEMVRRHGKTPTAFLNDLGVLGSGTTLAHQMFIDRHPAVRWHEEHDLEIMAGTGTHVVHCPGTFAFRGTALHDFGTYRKAGISMAIGTDTFPHNMAEEMRTALLLAKVAKGHVSHTRTEDIFHAATIGGAEVLDRNDIGRLVPGAKADIVLIDTAHASMQPCRDPVRSFIGSAGDRAVTDVFVNGRHLIANREYRTIDLPEALAAMARGHEATMAAVPKLDWAGRSAEEVSPLSLAFGETHPSK